MFPDFKRKQLKSSPLEVVICQLRFPTVLALTKEPPEEFQDEVAQLYPVTKQSSRQHIEIDAKGVSSSNSKPIWTFHDADEVWTVGIGDSFISLESKKYRNFEDFKNRFREVTLIATKLYPIRICDRLGLRYVNQISKKLNPNLPDNWINGIRAEALPFNTIEFRRGNRSLRSEARFFLQQHCLAIRSVLIEKNVSGGEQDDLVLDIDCYVQCRGPVKAKLKELPGFKRNCYNAFRWVLGDLINNYE